jgi:hypothetical protein
MRSRLGLVEETAHGSLVLRQLVLKHERYQ